VVEVATNDYFTLLQDIAPSANKKTYPDVDFLELGHPTKSESEYPTAFK